MITLKTLPQATEQEVFDQVAKHLLTQGVTSRKRVVNSEGGTSMPCQYRGDNGLQCAAGCLISDEEYEDLPLIAEGKTWRGLRDLALVPLEHFVLVGELQAIHDQYSPSNWKHQLDKLAVGLGLEFKYAEYVGA